ncbi:MAG: Lar family restriction alleviation protein [Chloroflexi bacterium]|nr:Lar family restriction alleviation protein [Chloroflexota bacterium]
MNPKLKPCPFCGASGDGLLMVDKTIRAEMVGEQIYYVQCAMQRGLGCEVHGPIRSTPEEAAAAWNMRIT